jgi:hypothetical protein
VLHHEKPYVARCEVGDRTVWVKRPRETTTQTWDPHNPELTWRIRREWSWLQFFGDHGPQLLQADLNAGWLAIDDLNADAPLVQSLLNGTPDEAATDLDDWTTEIIRLQQLSHGRQADFAALRTASGNWTLPFASDVQPALLALAAEMGVPAPPPAPPRGPAPDDVFVHGDPCPDNALRVGDRVRLLDFERSRWGNGLNDVLHLRLGQPTCWCAGTVPPELFQRVEGRHRAALAEQIPAFRDDATYAAALTEVVAQRVRINLAVFGGRRDNPDRWGTTTVRPRLLTLLDAFVEGAPHALQPWAEQVLRALEDSGSPDRLALFPAFRSHHATHLDPQDRHPERPGGS